MTRAKASSIAFDLTLLFSAAFLITAGIPFIHGKFETLIQSRPWIHRSLLGLVTLSMLFIWLCRDLDIEKRKAEPSFLQKFFQSIPFSITQWTWILFFVQACIFTCSSWIRYAAFHAGFDLAIFAQAVWNTAHGQFLYSSIKGGINLLGDHVSPILVLLSGFYALWPDPKNLLLIQALAAASCFFPLARIAAHEIADKKGILAVLFAYFFYLPIRNAVRFDFHPEMLADPFLLWAFYFLLTNRLRKTSFCLAIVLITKETMIFPIFFFSLYAFFIQKKKSFGLIWAGIAVAYAIFCFKIILPKFSPDPYFYLRGNYSLDSHPAFQRISYWKTWNYMVKIFLPVGWISFFSPPTLFLTVPIILQNFLAKNANATSIFFHYTAGLTPFVFISLIFGFKSLLRRVKIKTLIFWLMGWALLMTGVSEFYVMNLYIKKISPHTAEIKRYFASLDPRAAVRTHEFFAPHLANRKELYIFENQHPREGGSFKAMNAKYVLLDRMLLGDDAQKVFADLEARGYDVIFESDGFKAFQKKNSP